MASISDLIYTHQKTGQHYRVLHIAIEEGSMTPVVVYTSIFGGAVWTRPVAEFFDGRFITGGREPMADDTGLSLQEQT
jgi:hypothetical protein